jgi:tetratricopeptide (TPR) repeat protein
MLAGKPPFAGGTAVETGYAILRGEPAPLPHATDARISAVVARCLRKSADDRYRSAEEVEQALLSSRDAPPPTKPAAPTRSKLLPLALAALGGALVVIAALAVRSPPPPPPAEAALEASRIVVLPFAFRGSAAHEYLREGMVDLLSSALELSGFRAVDPTSVVRFASREAGAPEENLSRAAARRFHARLAIAGRIEETNGALHVEADAIDLSSDAPLKPVSADGSADDVLELAGKLAEELRLRAVGARLPTSGAAGRYAHIGLSSTRSPDALRAHLQGEAKLRRGQWSEAIDDFRRASSADPRFALAFYRLGVAASVREPGMADDALERAVKLGDALSARDRDLLAGFVAFRAGRAEEAEKRYRKLLAVDADDLDAWFQLGEVLFHTNAVRGHPPWQASAAFDRVLLLDPDHGAALVHLMWAAVAEGQLPAAARVAARYRKAAPEESFAAQWPQLWAAPDEAARAALFSTVQRPEAMKELNESLMMALLRLDDLSDAARLAEICSRRADPHEASRGSKIAGYVELARGRRRAALDDFALAQREDPTSALAMDRALIDALPFLRVEPAELRATRDAAARISPRTKEEEALLGYALGMLALRLDDRKSALSAADKLTASPPVMGASLGQDLALALRARVARAAGDWGAVRTALSGMRLDVPYRNHRMWWEWLPDHLLRAELAQHDGDDQRALEWLSSFAAEGPLSGVRYAPAMLARARLHDRRGERAAALGAYQKFVALWSTAEREQQPDVTFARERITALAGKQ